MTVPVVLTNKQGSLEAPGPQEGWRGKCSNVGEIEVTGGIPHDVFLGDVHLCLKFGREMVEQINQKGVGRKGGFWRDFQVAGPASGHGGRETEAVWADAQWAICYLLI